MSDGPAFKDRFSGHAEGYARSRPTYSESLFDSLAALPAPEFAMETDWDLSELPDYFGTWSAVQYNRKAKGEVPVAVVRGEMTAAWGDPAVRRKGRWPLSIRLARPR